MSDVNKGDYIWSTGQWDLYMREVIDTIFQRIDGYVEPGECLWCGHEAREHGISLSKDRQSFPSVELHVVWRVRQGEKSLGR